MIHDLLNRSNRVMAPPAQTCHVCGAPVLDATVCNECWRKVRKALRTVPALADELDVTVSKQAKASEAQRVSGSPVPPLPMQPDAAACRDDLRATR